MRRLFFAAALLCAVVSAVLPVKASEPLLDVLQTELDYEFGRLSGGDTPPYYMNFRVTDTRSRTVGASFGVLNNSTDTRERVFVPHIRLGTAEFDNYHGGGLNEDRSWSGPVLLPLEEGEEAAIRQVIWREVERKYRSSVTELERLRAAERVNVARDDKAPDFSAAPVEKYYEEPLAEAETAFDEAEMARRVKAYSAVFAGVPELMSGAARVDFTVQRKYFVSSEGASVVQNWRFCRLSLTAFVRTEDGMDLPLYNDYVAYSPDGLPSDEVVLADARRMAETLLAMKRAPIVTPYTGPALLSGEASGVFFHEIFGHRIEGQRMKSDSDGQTFKKMIGQSVLPRHFSVYDDPTMATFEGTDLHGHYIYDDQGVKGRRVEVVRNGVLNEFLMTRTPTDEFAVSNGHSRAQANLDPTSRQSNLVITTDKHLTDAQLRKMLIKEAKAQKLEFGLYFKEVTGGFTMTGRFAANSFNVMPLEVYKIYVDGRPDELVRGVDLIGTPLSMFANIIEAGGENGIFTGNCGAESGWVPVTGISPEILVKKVEVQRKAKTSDLPPILAKPEVRDAAYDNAIFGAMEAELARSMDSLRMADAGHEPFWTGYVYADMRTLNVSATLGEVVESDLRPYRYNAVKVLLGNNAVTSDLKYDGAYSVRSSAVETDPAQIRREFWLNTDAAYKRAAQDYARKITIREQANLSDEEANLGDWLDVAPVEKIIEGPAFGLDKAEWERRVAELSAVMAEFPSLYGSRVNVTAYDWANYILSSDGVKMRQPASFACVSVTATVRTPDGEVFSDSSDIYATSDETFPSQEELRKFVRDFAQKLADYGAAPRFEEFYSGPVLFVGQPVFRMFDGNLLSNDGGSLLVKRPAEGQRGSLSPRRLSKRLGQRVLDSRLSVWAVNYLTREWNGTPLLGYYEIDADGKVPAFAAEVIANGVLKGLLYGRIPTLDIPAVASPGGSNRFSVNLQPHIAPGVLEITASNGTSRDALEKQLVKLAKADGLRYAYIVERMSGRVNLVWRVDVATGARELVRDADVTAVTLAQLKRLAGVSNVSEMRNYLAGQVPASMIYPSAVLMEDVEIGAAEHNKEKALPIVNPLER